MAEEKITLPDDALLASFLSDVDAAQPAPPTAQTHVHAPVPHADSKATATHATVFEWTSEAQITRILRPGAAYRNLNPFDVLLIPHNAPPEEVKRQYRKLSILVHPDKNSNNPRAHEAFEAVNKAHKMLENEESRQKCERLVNDAKGRLDAELVNKRRAAARDANITIATKAPAAGEEDPLKANGLIEEDRHPEEYEKRLRIAICKAFADMEQRRRELDIREATLRKRKREQEIEEEEKRKKDAAYKKEWEETRTQRVASWRDFASGKGKTKSSGPLKPPSLKTEGRAAQPK